MRLFHTADWHVGKKLGRIDRRSECERVLDQVVEAARGSDVDVVVVAGDLFDRALPPFESLGLVLDTLRRLAEVAPVVAIPGNHDSAGLFGVLAPYLAPSRVHIVDRIRAPERGGIVEVAAQDGKTTARVACMPFLHETQTVELVEATEEWFKSYADRVRAITKAYSDALAATRQKQHVDVLAGHFMVHGAKPSGSERELHIGDAFMARSDSLPPGLNYTALGHIHQMQQAPGSENAWFAGSLMQLDFGEAGHHKFVLVADMAPERPGARVERIPITAGRNLRRVRGSLEEIEAEATTYGDDILDVTVMTDGPAPGLADEVRALLPNALYVRAEYGRVDPERKSRVGRPMHELYADYYESKHGAAAPKELIAAFKELADRAGVQV